MNHVQTVVFYYYIYDLELDVSLPQHGVRGRLPFFHLIKLIS